MPILYIAPDNTELTQRCSTIFLSNPEGGIPSVTFSRQVVIEQAGMKATKELPACSLELTSGNAATTFPWLNASDDSSTSKTLTYAEVYDIMYSLAKHAIEIT